MAKDQTSAEEMKTTIRIKRRLARATRVWAAEHDMSFNDAVIEALKRLTKERA